MGVDLDGVFKRKVRKGFSQRRNAVLKMFFDFAWGDL